MPVLLELGVPVWLPVWLEEGVPVWLELGVPVVMGLGVLVTLELGSNRMYKYASPGATPGAPTNITFPSSTMSNAAPNCLFDAMSEL